MKIQQRKFSLDKGWQNIGVPTMPLKTAQLVLVFGSTQIISNTLLYDSLRTDYPDADILINSTAGEIIDSQVNDDTISLTAIHFEKTILKSGIVQISDFINSFEAGKNLAAQFEHKQLSNVLVISDGHLVNGSELVMGLQENLPSGTLITGGLAGDGVRFEKTLVGLNESPIEGRIVAIGFYGDSFKVTHGSVGGWDSFGHDRLISKSSANVLYELDDKPALDIYKLYLGEFAAELPMSALRFPLSIRTENSDYSLVRTILSVNELDKSMTFAGNIPQGGYARLMKSNFDRLIEGAGTAAHNSISGSKPDLAILISCVGRKLVLDHRIEEEVEVVRAAYGNDTVITGFYSYGEISPMFNVSKCELHNQTMTVTTLTEI